MLISPDLQPPLIKETHKPISSTNERRLWLFLAIWFAAGVLQSIFTNLDGEEAYYATFARNLAWGYFDHPPAVAFFARLGMMVFSGDLGPRFMMVVLSTATLWIGSRLVEYKQIPLYIITVAALVLIQAGSFLVKTDVPLLFFATVFFYYYRAYLQGRERLAVVALPIAIAGMILSKYHGILVVVMTLLSNPGLLRRPSFWLITLFSCILMFPHAAWLYSHDFVTIRYHLGGRTDSGFSWKNVIGYVFMQPFVFGPAVGVLLLPAALMARTRDGFEKTLKYNLVGILIFFFVASFAVRIHMHWTSIALIPVLALGIPYLFDRLQLRKILEKLAVVSIVAFIPVRLYLAWDYLPAFIDRKMEIVHGENQWAQDVRQLADGRNVVFICDYVSAGKYSYYTGEMAHSYNAFGYQSTQQDLWPLEENFRGKPAMIVNGLSIQQFKTTHARNGSEIRYRFVDDFQAYTKVEIRLNDNSTLHCNAGTPFPAPITLVSHYDRPILFKGHTELSPSLMYYFFKGPQIVCSGSCDVVAGTVLSHEARQTVLLQPPKTPGSYLLYFSIQPGWLPPSSNSRAYPVTVAPASPPSAIAAGFH